MSQLTQKKNYICSWKKFKTNVSKICILLLQLTSHRILHYLCSADLSKSFTQLIVSIFIFPQYFFSIECARWKKLFSIDCVNTNLFSLFFLIYFVWVEKCGITPHGLSRDSLILTLFSNESFTSLSVIEIIQKTNYLWSATHIFLITCNL